MTLSAQEAHELALNTPQVTREAAQQVLDYLLWHKTMVSESLQTTETLDRYMGLVQELKEGVHVVIEDPYQKATALLFELVLSERFNPWDIDLVRFTGAFMERQQKDQEVDFPVAGRLVHMAWRILLLQSLGVLSQREAELAPPPDPSAELSDGPVDDSYLGAMSSPEQVDVTEAVLRSDGVPLESMVRHPEVRPVSLIELANALQSAQDAARLREDAAIQRERLRAWQRSAPEVLAHGDVPESELADTWAHVARHPIGEPFPFEELLEGVKSRERVVALFLSVLFLSRDRVLVLHQTDLSTSGFLVERQAETRKPAGEEPPAPAPEPSEKAGATGGA
jgi:segregation and condensation protein A